MGKFEYQTLSASHKGYFNIYQAKSGQVYIMMGNVCTGLTEKQIKDLNIDCYSLEDFSHDDYMLFYK